MPNPFEDSTSLFPEITQAVDEAYDENVSNGTAQDVATEEEPNLGDIAAQDTESAKESGTLAFATLENMKDQEISAKFADTFEVAKKLYEKIGLVPPTADQFAAAGVNFNYLATNFKQWKRHGSKPELIITPIIRLTNGPTGAAGAPSWVSLFKKIMDDEKIPENKIWDFGNYSGLELSDEITSVDQQLLLDEEIQVSTDKETHNIKVPTGSAGDSIIWTVSIIDGSNAASESQHIDDDGNPYYPDELLTSLSQYLSLQAIRAQKGETPVDAEEDGRMSDTMIRSKIIDKDGNMHDVTGSYNILTRVVSLTCMAAGIFSQSTGCRYPLNG